MLDLEANPIIPVIVLDDANDAEPLAEALLEGGLKIIEITFRTAAAAESISRIVQRFPEMVVGAGTVVTEKQAKEAIDAGSQFGLAPGTDPKTLEIFRGAGIPFIPGIATPSDIQAAYREGCQYMKFFPAGPMGGVKMLKALSAPYGNLGIRFCPTGGVSLDNMEEYLSLPSVFAVGGSWIATKQDISEKNWKIITENATQALSKISK
ncbi:bifunctional 4-hydroxy-2-oxoglutarate aldolase/2-dehydro-3-deoxy-phosphogluconate aldolase [Puniceicoccus vermicola]|uniref:2-dehydro-3-deoxy-phosphogluconate aldolase n=1 Tax=Puniceicoccus vermicola TaxID=388746 RepID=A0A7X1AYG7_9BACT|nr:bifunctional 4-hydroxy-2-oxoglutarate aldolase/2-dehydro-3-deoxy-phosphogluconate aldolase [Puniceicoccus vermicola]MBC2602311.1 bifunctional 4-hydroxy-2-oxoglutarate aldolase/2-dehydro-3-deoxy-phosphogluconate aldolase [Puniceicoccus vermicola]